MRADEVVVAAQELEMGCEFVLRARMGVTLPPETDWQTSCLAAVSSSPLGHVLGFAVGRIRDPAEFWLNQANVYRGLQGVNWAVRDLFDYV